jgi:hypothetical protein
MTVADNFEQRENVHERLPVPEHSPSRTFMASRTSLTSRASYTNDYWHSPFFMASLDRCSPNSKALQSIRFLGGVLRIANQAQLEVVAATKSMRR